MFSSAKILKHEGHRKRLKPEKLCNKLKFIYEEN